MSEQPAGAKARSSDRPSPPTSGPAVALEHNQGGIALASAPCLDPPGMSEGCKATAACIPDLASVRERDFIDHYLAWWSDRQDDLRSLDQRGFSGVIDRWAAAGNRRSYLPETLVYERVLDVLGADLRTRLERLAAAERQGLVDIYHSWGDRYSPSLMDLERQSEDAAARLKARLKELGYTGPA
ncbi:hypothetical protein [Streptomyces sp. S1]|uniref:hypothetical protein n=1 Tax=Streptomyces sp. S1 TaxID=718288 RepID=UPI003D726851